MAETSVIVGLSVGGIEVAGIPSKAWCAQLTSWAKTFLRGVKGAIRRLGPPRRREPAREHAS